jgi:hypothetical protein
MSIKPRLLVVTFTLSLCTSIGCHSAYADFMAPFDDGDNLETFQSHQDMGNMSEENQDMGDISEENNVTLPLSPLELENIIKITEGIDSQSAFDIKAYENLTHFNPSSKVTEALENPKTYKAQLDNKLNDEILAIKLAQRSHFDGDKAALAASHPPETWGDKFLNFIRWDKILSFMEKNKASAEQWEQFYVK